MNEKEKAAEETAEEIAQAESPDTPAAAEIDYKAEYEKTQAALKESEATNKANSDRIAKLEADSLRSSLTAIAAEFAGDRTQKVDFMITLANKFGQDSAEFKAYVEDQKALAAQVKTGGLFKETGSTGATTDGSAEAKVDALAKERAKEKGITYEKAYAQILDENRQLYAEMSGAAAE